MERKTGTVVTGVRTPYIEPNDNLAKIICECVLGVSKIKEKDVVAITESVVAVSQNNFAHVDDIAADIIKKFGSDKHIGVVFPILSRNRFARVLQGISKGAKKLTVLLNYPQDEVGNPIIDLEKWNPYAPHDNNVYSGKDFRKKYGEYKHEFTSIDYIDLYTSLNDNIEVIVAKDPAGILKYTSDVIAADIHTRKRTKEYLLKSGAKKVLTLDELINEPAKERGYNKDYGLLGSNVFGKGGSLKLFPRDCEKFAYSVQEEFGKRCSVKPHVMVYADGAFKDPKCGIWELADPVVSPGYTKGLNGSPNEVKLKMVVAGEKDKEAVLRSAIANKATSSDTLGTTPRQYPDLLGSLADLVSGSGDKGTPVILIQGFFDSMID